MAKIFKSRSVVLADESVAVDNQMPVINTSPEFVDKTGLGLKSFEDPDPPFDGTAEEAIAEQDRIIRDAKEEAKRIIDEAEKQAEIIDTNAAVKREQLKRRAVDEGKTEGYSAGFEAGKAESDKLRDEAAAVLKEAEETREEMITSAEPDMISLVMNIVKSIIGEALILHPGAIAAIIRAGLLEANTSNGVTVRVCPEDCENLLQLKKVLASAVDTGAKLTVVKDPALNKHDVMIETAFGAIDCSLDQQIEAVTDNLFIIMNAGV